MTGVAAFLIGLLFGTGLLLSGMANPQKVLGFLDLAGAWDPTLPLVMAGAVAVGIVAFRVVAHRKASLLGLPLRIPAGWPLDGRLLSGSALFGIGWGLVGICPGPAVVALGAGQPKAAAFVLAMLAGMAGYEFVLNRSTAEPRSAERGAGT